MSAYITHMDEIEALNNLGWYLTVLAPFPGGAACWFERIGQFSMN